MRVLDSERGISIVYGRVKNILKYFLNRLKIQAKQKNHRRLSCDFSLITFIICIVNNRYRIFEDSLITRFVLRTSVIGGSGLT